MAQGTFDDVRRARRILCCGVTGSGKSTLAAALAQARELPGHLVGGWPCLDARLAVTTRGEFDAEIARILDSEKFALDSLYGRHVC